MSSMAPEAGLSPTTQPPQHARLGRGAQVVGVVGVIVCILLAAGVWLGRGWAVGKVNDVVASVDQGLARADDAATQAADRVDAVAESLDALATRAQTLAENPDATAADLHPLSVGTTDAADRYRAFRATYGELRERAVSAIDTLTRVDRFVPGFSVPQQPIDALDALDQRVQALDTTISGVVAAVDALSPASVVAPSVATQASNARDELVQASSRVRSITDITDRLRQTVSDLGSRIDLLVTGVAIAATLLLAYTAGLHIALWALGGRWRAS